jgi:alpha-L-rhamnosidase
MNRSLLSWPLILLSIIVSSGLHAQETKLQILDLRCEYGVDPLGIESTAPRLSWRLASPERGAAQSARRILVASSPEILGRDEGDLWDSGKVDSPATTQIAYGGRELASRDRCFWKVKVWDERGQAAAWSAPANWMMGLLQPSDWQAKWVAWRDTTPLHTNAETLHLPPAHHYRKEFSVAKPIKQAVAYTSALGIFDLHLNSQRVSDAYFQPGWSDYAKRAYYRAHDVTALLRKGKNAIGAVVADGWYAGYAGLGALKKYGAFGTGRYNYGKTPALLVQLEITYLDGSREFVVTDENWRVTGDGPFREADILMGESYDARKELTGWSSPGYDDREWMQAVAAESNGVTRALFLDPQGDREVNLGFQAPLALQSYAAPPIRVTQELPARAITEPSPGVYIFDLGQNFAGNVRLKVKGKAGTTVKLRYGEMLHPDGRLMTENLRKARATDFYTLRGDPAGETWSPRFTYHGFQYVELTGLDGKPSLDALTGLVIHNDTRLTGSFECSDPLLTKFAQNALWTQRANFFEIPTDCPQRDERLGWTGDAQAYVRTASYNADIASFFTKWQDDLSEAQLSFGAFPDYAPYPTACRDRIHYPKSFAPGWTDAGVICPWTLWQVYGDTRLIERHWKSLTRFMDWRNASTTSAGLGTSIGNIYGDWLNQNDPTPLEYIDTCYHAWDCRLMAEMAATIGRPLEAAKYRQRFERIRSAFVTTYHKGDGLLNADSQTAYVLALWSGLMPEAVWAGAARHLAEKINANGVRMSTGFLGTRALLPALSAHGHHDLAVRLFQSRRFPSWGYEVANGANTVWERWDSYTTEHGFFGQSGQQTATMNSFSHYALGAVMEWAYQTLAGIDTDGSGFQQVLIKPRPPKSSTAVAGEETPINWVKARYNSIHGPIATEWHRNARTFTLTVTLPANANGSIWLPAASADDVTESGQPLARAIGLEVVGQEEGGLMLRAKSGTYSFAFNLPHDYE